MAAPKLALKVAKLEKQLVVLTDEVARLKEQVGNEVALEVPWWEKHWGIFDVITHGLEASTKDRIDGPIRFASV